MKSKSWSGKGTKLLTIWALALFFIISPAAGFSRDYVAAKPKTGDGIYSMLRRYQLPTTPDYLGKFKEMNGQYLDTGGNLQMGVFYNMPIYRVVFDGKTIRSSLQIDDFQQAKKIEEYNQQVFNAGIKRKNYKNDLELWVPVFLLPAWQSTITETAVTITREANTFTIFGKDYQKLDLIDNSLKDHVYYLVSGHGGPDPGAVAKRNGNKLCEDEYAYDITLRLARNLMQHGARVYMIVQDPNDGIRDDGILKPDTDEIYYGGSKISTDVITRLDKRAQIINSLYNQNKATAKKQATIIIHVDSRSNSKRIDIFYYYKNDDPASKNLANVLYKIINRKYSEHQPGRGYGGKVLTRDLHMLRKCLTSTVYIELGNIKNPLDQDRLVIVNNRQAVANWLCEGVIKAAEN